MKRVAQLTLVATGRQSLDHYASALQQVEDLSADTTMLYIRETKQDVQ